MKSPLSQLVRCHMIAISKLLSLTGSVLNKRYSFVRHAHYGGVLHVVCIINYVKCIFNTTFALSMQNMKYLLNVLIFYTNGECGVAYHTKQNIMRIKSLCPYHA